VSRRRAGSTMPIVADRGEQAYHRRSAPRQGL
jgi:hypothetical protein